MVSASASVMPLMCTSKMECIRKFGPDCDGSICRCHCNGYMSKTFLIRPGNPKTGSMVALALSRTIPRSADYRPSHPGAVMYSRVLNSAADSLHHLRGCYNHGSSTVTREHRRVENLHREILVSIQSDARNPRIHGPSPSGLGRAYPMIHPCSMLALTSPGVISLIGWATFCEWGHGGAVRRKLEPYSHF